MILTFHVPTQASGQGLCYIDGVQLGVPQKNFKKMESTERLKIEQSGFSGDA